MLDFAQARRMMVDCASAHLRRQRSRRARGLRTRCRARASCRPAAKASPTWTRTCPSSDGAGPGERRFMLAPMVLARMIQALELAAGAARSRYRRRARLFGRRAGAASAASVIGSRERRTSPRRCAGRLGGVEGVAVEAGPLDRGCPDAAPYDAVLVNGAVETRSGDAAAPACASAGGSPASRDEDGPRGRRSMCAPATAFGARALFDAAAPSLAAFRRGAGLRLLTRRRDATCVAFLRHCR